MRAVAYARFSSDLQRAESIDAQIRAITEYCRQNDHTLLTVYADRAASGTTDNRPEFARMIGDSAKGEFDLVIVHKLDRFARNRYDSAFNRHVLKKNNVKLISVVENLQDTPESVILESVIEGMNEYYSLNLAREVRKGLLENAMSCKVTGGPPALGYSVDPETQKYVINDWEAEAVRMIFSMYLDGYSYGEIIGALNSKGYRTRRGQPFAKNSIYSILRNERYTGVYIYVKDTSKNPQGKYTRHGEYDPDAVVRIPGGIPAIISEEDFRLVQEKMKERQHKAAKFTAKQEYLLSGKIYCGECGSPYAGNSRKPRPGHPLYISYKCTKRNQREKCLNPEINRDKLEDIVLSRLSSVVFNPALIPELVTKFNDYVAEKTGSALGKIEPLRSELRKVEHKIRVTVNLMIDTESDAMKEKLHELEETKAKLVYELSEAEAAVSQAGFSEEQVRQLFGQAEQQLTNGTLTNRRMVVDRFVDKVVMFPDRVEIYLNPIGDMTIKEVVEKV